MVTLPMAWMHMLSFLDWQGLCYQLTSGDLGHTLATWIALQTLSLSNEHKVRVLQDLSGLDYRDLL